MRYLQDRNPDSAWVPIARHRTEPVTLIVMKCGHIRILKRPGYRFLGKRGLMASCEGGCPGLQYLVSIGTIPATREGESCSGR